MRVLIVTDSGPRAASFRYRVHQHIKGLEEEGLSCEVTSAKALPLSRLGRLRHYDAVLVQKRLFPISWVLTASRLAKIIFDFDDAIWTSPKQDWKLLTRARTASRLRTMLARAACVTAGNSYLAGYASRYNRNVRIIPTCIDTEYYLPGPSRTPEEIRIGWVGSKPNLPYLEGLEPVFSKLSANPDVRLLVVCNERYDSPSLPTEFVPWTLEGELETLRKIDIGIMPLPDDEWTRGKCGFKLIQYMACGIPSVASRVGFNNELVTDGRNGLLASDEDEWVSKLSLLFSDAELRCRIGKEGRSTVEGKYSLRVGTQLLGEAIRSTAGPK